MVDALLCGRLIQLMDGNLGTNAHDCGCGNDNGCDVFGHGWYEVNATECGNAEGRDCTCQRRLDGLSRYTWCHHDVYREDR